MILTGFISLLACLSACELSSALDSPLIGQSFRIKTRVFRQGFSQNSDLLLEEIYSKSQNRARIRYPSTETELSGSHQREFHYDAYNEHGLLYSSTQNTCDQVDLLQFYSSHLRFLPDFNKLMQLEIPNSNPVIGPARLLLLVADRASLLRDQFGQTVYGIPLVRYNLEVPLPGDGGQSVLLRIYYDRTTHESGSLRDQFPLFIVWESLWLHYFQLEIRPETGKQFQAKRNEASAGADRQSEEIVVVDEFAIPFATKCLQSLPKSNIYSLFDMQSFRFSFEAETLHSSGFLEHYWVQFDGLLQALRVDQHQHQHQHHAAPAEPRSSIFNFRTNRKYLITGGQSDQRPRRCLVMKNLGRERANLRLADLLVGQGTLALLGEATVRGVDASVYGALSDKLPHWLDQPVLYQDGNGTEESLRRRGGSPGDEPANGAHTDGVGAATGAERDRYKLLVYLDESKENRPLALDVYELLDGNEWHRSLRVLFRDFAWQLAEAPDGRQTSELFTLADSCAANATEAHYLEVELLLRQDEISAIADSRSRGGWIQDWPTRNLALLAGLADSLDLDCTMIHDLESRLKSGQRMALEVRFKLAERAQLLHSVRLLGRANLRPASNHVGELAFRHSGSALLLADCLALAAGDDAIQDSPTYVYYSEEHSACLVDSASKGTGQDQEDGAYGSPLIELVSKSGDTATGELYRIEAHLDHPMFSTGIIQDQRLRALSNRVLFLSHATGRPAQPIDPAVFKLRIEHMKINSNSYLSGPSNNQAASYSGVALLAEGRLSRLVKLDDQETPIEFSQCQAACLADDKCGSYSFCVRFPQGGECVLSELASFESIEKMAADSLQEIITIKTATQDEVKLRKDARCELHRKSYLGQFIRADMSRNILHGHWIIPVSGAEECAQSCFMKTLELLQQMDHGSGLSGEHALQVCSRFLYLNSLLDDGQRDAVQEALGAADFDVQAHLGGFCLIKHSLQTEKKGSPRVFFDLERYDFDFTTLYEKTPGVGLSDTSTEPERAAQERLYRDGSRQEDLEVLAKADKEGRNVQSKLASTSELRCARRCILQATRLWPACRSFDVVRLKQLSSHAAHVECVFNTRLASESGLLDQVCNGSSQSIADRWHYEPRWDRLRRAIELSAQTRVRSEGGHSEQEQSGQGFLKSALAAIGLIILAKLSGLILGMKLTERFLRNRRHESHSKTTRDLCTDSDGGDIALE